MLLRRDEQSHFPMKRTLAKRIFAKRVFDSAPQRIALTLLAAVTTVSALTNARADLLEPSANTMSALAPDTAAAPSGLIQVPDNSQYYSPYSFLVDKAARTLSVWRQTPQGPERIAQFPADLGKNTGDKRFSGDHKTPEGIYFLKERLEGKQIDFNLYGRRAFTTDYPNFFDKMEGKTGYGIWLHAVPDEVPLTRGSRGCVVVRNNVILDISQYVRLGRTPILIQGETRLKPKSEMEALRARLNQWLEDWRVAWEKKDLDTYIGKYAENFRSMRMNRGQWRAYKAGLNEKYRSIAVRLSRPAIYLDGKQIVARFLQEYTSDRHSDFGEKILYMVKQDDDFKIVGETWTVETSQVARAEIEATTRTKAAACANANECVQTSSIGQ